MIRLPHSKYQTLALAIALSTFSLSPCAEVIYGTDNSETLTGTTGADSLFGYGGNDILRGGPGNDRLDGGKGEDLATFIGAGGSVRVDLSARRASGAHGNDTLVDIENIQGSIYDDELTGDASDNILTGDRGDDYLDGGDGSDTANYSTASSAVTVKLTLTAEQDTGGAGSDTLLNIENLRGSIFDDALHGDDNNNILSGKAGNDTLVGYAGNDNLVGGQGNDNLLGGTGNDYLWGGDGEDTANYSRDNAAVTVNLNITGAQDTLGAGSDKLVEIENIEGSRFADTLTGNSVDNKLYGHAGDDTLDGINGENLLEGGAGNDTLISGRNYDTLDGGDGTDTASYINAVVGVEVNLESEDSQDTIGAGHDILRNIENLQGSDFNDKLTGDSGENVLSGGEGNDTLTGGDGHDILNGGNGTDTASYASSSSGVEVSLATSGYQNTLGADYDRLIDIENITGSNFNDVLTGNDDNNTLSGLSGDDLIMVGRGSNFIKGGSGNDTVSYANSAGVFVSLGLDDYQITNGGSKDKLESIENIIGSAYDDELTGDGQVNILNGGAGNDTLYGGDGDDYLIGGVGNDTLYGDGGIDTISYADSSSKVTVDLSQGTANSSEGFDRLTSIENVIGSDFNDTLTGDTNNNQLNGGRGNDTLNGGDGDDTYIWDNSYANQDTINESSGNDILKYTQAVDIADIVVTADGQQDLVIDLDARNSVTIKNHSNNNAIETLSGSGTTQNLRGNFEQIVSRGQFEHYVIAKQFATADNMTNKKELTVTGTLTNNHQLTNKGSLIVTDGAHITNIGTIQNQTGANIQFDGTSTLSGSLINNGDIVIADTKALRLTGNLSGTGRFIGDTVLNGVDFTPGNSPGTMTFDGDTIWKNVDLTLEIAALAGGGFEYDQVNILGDLTLLSTLNINLDLLYALDPSDIIGQSFNFINVMGDVFDGNQQPINLADWVNIIAGWTASWTQSINDNSWQLSFSFLDNDNANDPTTSVPEPTSLALFLLAYGLLYSVRRKQIC